MSQERIELMAKRAREASQIFASSTLESRNNLLKRLQDALVEQKDSIVTSNKADLANARTAELNSALISRLELSEKKINACIEGISQIIDLPDPLNKCTYASELSPNQHLYRLTCPIGVIAIIFEARPEACIQIISLCLKSGNAVLLKGGKESCTTLEALEKTVHSILPQEYTNIVQFVNTRDEMNLLLHQEQYIDLVIPRGGYDLVRHVRQNTKIPVLSHGDGICFLYLSKNVKDMEKAVDIIVDSKYNSPSACNALEVLLVQEESLPSLATVLKGRLRESTKINTTKESLEKVARFFPTAGVGEVFQEYLSDDFSIVLVKSVMEAIELINCHGSHHTDVIVSDDGEEVELFLSRVNSSCVFANASSRFADGYRFGFGAEIGISTNRIHARGPVGMEGLVIYKYRMYGDGHTLQMFDKGETHYTHKSMEGIKGLHDIQELSWRGMRCENN